MRMFTLKTLMEIVVGVSANVTAGWFGLLLVAPGFFGVTPSEYLGLLTRNLPLGIVGLLICTWLSERTKRL